MGKTTPSDRDLGLNAAITRRDFMNGVLLGTGVLAAGTGALAAGGGRADSPAHYPPAETGLRGSHTGSFEVAHAVARDGKQFTSAAPLLDDVYALIVVGAGLSGLSAAYFFAQQRPGARVLLIDNHDDFGGHAKRNEFSVGGRALIGYGGSQSIDGPAHYSDVAKALLRSLGVDTNAFYEAFDAQLYARFGMRPGIAFSGDAFTRDTVVATDIYQIGDGLPSTVIESLPLSPSGRADLTRLTQTDLMGGAKQADRLARLKSVSYLDYLQQAKIGAEVATLLKRSPNTFWGLDFDALSALEGHRLGAPGFTGLAPIADGYPDDEPYIFHFPDGNAGIARLLVRKLIPDAAPGETMTDVVTAPFDYAALDRAASNIRIRLSSTVTRVLPGRQVEVVYANSGTLGRVRGKQCILACYPRMIPHVLPELPESQRRAMAEAVRTPLVYTNVVLRNWKAFAAAGTDRLYCPTGTYPGMMLDFPVSLGSYHCPRSEEEPIVVHLATAPVPGDGSHPKDQFKAGRHYLLSASSIDMERDVRLQLNAVMGRYGFDAARDILALTINRWPHGYAREFNELFDRWAPHDAPWIAARQPFGNIAMAASDTQGRAYVDAAIDAAHRAVGDLMGA